MLYDAQMLFFKVLVVKSFRFERDANDMPLVSRFHKKHNWSYAPVLLTWNLMKEFNEGHITQNKFLIIWTQSNLCPEIRFEMPKQTVYVFIRFCVRTKAFVRVFWKNAENRGQKSAVCIYDMFPLRAIPARHRQILYLGVDRNNC